VTSAAAPVRHLDRERLAALLAARL